jgi:hypothetical protein
MKAMSGETLKATMVVSKQVRETIRFWAPADRGEVVFYELFVCAFLSKETTQRMPIAHGPDHPNWPVHEWRFTYVPGLPTCEPIDRGEPSSTT